MLIRALSFFGGWSSLVQFGVIAGLIATGLYMINDYKSLSSKNTSLRVEVSTLKNKIEVIESSRALDKDTIRALDERLKQKAGDLDAFCKILGDAQSSKEPGADDVAGEPIGSTLEALKKLGGKK